MQNLLTEERARSTVVAREADVIRRANNLLRVSERQRQDEIASLQADLEFYRRLGGANGSQAPLSVHHLELETTQSPRVYRVNLQPHSEPALGLQCFGRSPHESRWYPQRCC